ncbi:MAG: DUF192 domain-containing protein [Candidatus Obscuribacterales bacterium]|nr:DUF192 domain-containing protein [Candidatus Obscuribacterales bacterium]
MPTILLAFLCAILLPLSASAFFPTAEIGKERIKLEVAQSAQQIERGLMYRTSLPEDSGMVFLFTPARPVRFWMRNCFISLDMLFIKNGKIVRICHDVPPCKAAKAADCPLYPENGEIEASEVLEVNAGYAAKHGIKEGDTIKFDLGAVR